MEDLKRSKKPVLELLIPLRFDVFTIQPDLLAQSIVTTLNSFVMGSFLQLLYIE